MEGVNKMFLLFHILVPFIIVIPLANLMDFNYNKLYLLIGALIADIDKVLSVLHISAGRGYCHSILFSLLFITGAYFISNKSIQKYGPFTFAIIVHLFLDFTLPFIRMGTIEYLIQTPLFFPFCDCNLSPTSLNLIETIAYFSDILVHRPIVSYTELVSAYILAFYYLLNRIQMSRSEVLILK
jgi:hypothetical protein